MQILETVVEGIGNAGLMAYEVWWALVLGFAISAIVQAWVPKESIERRMSGGGLGPVMRATGLGAASSSCSYAAIAIGKSLFQKGAGAASALAFQFASTNLVWELGLVMWLILGWQFALAEFVGGIILIVLMWALLRLFVSRSVEQAAREHAQHAETGHQHHSNTSAGTLRTRLTSTQAWSDVAHNFRGDWQMLWKEITIGFLLAGYVSLLPMDIFNTLFLADGSGFWRQLENVIVGPLIAILAFVCSVGNVPLAAVLWSGGISFAGVLSFIFADLIVLPIIVAYRKYYGWNYALRIVALMFVVMIIAALLVDALFSTAGLVPTTRPHHSEMFAGIKLDYKLVLNVLGAVAFAALMVLTAKRGATDPICGMTVDKATALSLERDSVTHYFCSEHCRTAFASGVATGDDSGTCCSPAHSHH